MTTEIFKWTEEVEKSIYLEWSNSALFAGHAWALKHERDIPEGFPAPLAEKCREIIQANRELEEGETRLRGVGIVGMSVEGDLLHVDGVSLPFSEQLLRDSYPHKPERLAYLLKHRELQPNQVRFDGGEVVEMRMETMYNQEGVVYLYGSGSCGVAKPRESDPGAWKWPMWGSISDPAQRQRVRDFYERERRVESKEMRFDVHRGTACAVPDRFDGRRVKVTFEDLGPIES